MFTVKGYVELEIQKIEKLLPKNTFVYNLEVEEDHTYTITNSTVHNCDSAALMCWAVKGEGLSRPVTENENPFLYKNSSSFYISRNRFTARRR